MGPISPGRWQVWQFFCKTGSTSLLKVTVEDAANANDAAMLKGYLGFLLGSQGQALLAPLNYAPLPSNIDSMATAQLSQITS